MKGHLTKDPRTRLHSPTTILSITGIDGFEVVDMSGSKFQVLNMVDLGTTFQLYEVVNCGSGQPSSSECLKALQKRWFSWGGHPVHFMCDRGLHNRGVAKYMDEHGIQVHHSLLEAPENIGRVERHGGIAKALFRKVGRDQGSSTSWQRTG